VHENCVTQTHTQLHMHTGRGKRGESGAESIYRACSLSSTFLRGIDLRRVSSRGQCRTVKNSALRKIAAQNSREQYSTVQ
jgi:hypothetical protein